MRDIVRITTYEIFHLTAKRLISAERSQGVSSFFLEWLIARFKHARGYVTRISSGSRTPLRRRDRGGEISTRARVNFSRVSRDTWGFPFYPRYPRHVIHVLHASSKFPPCTIFYGDHLTFWRKPRRRVPPREDISSPDRTDWPSPGAASPRSPPLSCRGYCASETVVTFHYTRRLAVSAFFFQEKRNTPFASLRPRLISRDRINQNTPAVRERANALSFFVSVPARDASSFPLGFAKYRVREK